MAEIVKEKDALTPGANDLEILHPERTATIAGRKITMREYGFVEGLKVRALTKPLIDALHKFVADGSVPSAEEVQVILAEHADTVVVLMAKAADVDTEWVASLNQYEGDDLMAMWWGCNGPFFMRKAIDRLKQEKLSQLVRAGQMPMQNSSPMATSQTESSTTLSDK